jgi:hypothetical protein
LEVLLFFIFFRDILYMLQVCVCIKYMYVNYADQFSWYF